MGFNDFFRHIPKAMWQKRNFYLKLPRNASLLDIGCGNESPAGAKYLRPDIFYAGIDVGNYNNSKESLSMADEYLIVEADKFPEGISSICGDKKFDAIVSSHNLEHCNRPEDTLDAMCRKLKKGGRMFLAFPCEKSIDFPHREGTLNFYDDKTHVKPPVFE